ncbi:carboxypeptidase-like regulatory domain-containing protein [Aeoliella sp.]|uniref:carboxypeptidase-like regulatory domain-containing protein n=1 Tax=Aeoliella sp. TaxID=2795800 RepID=UPI003CCC111F
MRIQTLGRLAAAIACVGMIMPSAALSAEPVAAQAPSLDVALGEGGVFRGQVVDAHGAAQAHQDVALVYQGREVVRTKTDEQGVFAARGLRGGQYQLVTQDQVAPFRLWSANAAPPTARPAALIVSGSQAVNGQYGGGGILGWMQAHPLIVAGAVVTAIAVPVAITASDDDSSS